MKWLLPVFLFFPFISNAQKDSSCTMDMYGCYVYSLKALINGNSGLIHAHELQFKKKTKTLYIPKRFYTTALPEELEGIQVKYIDLDTEKDKIYEAVKHKKAALYYLSELNITATMCDLWIMPIGLNKVSETIEPDYTELGCHLFFKVCGDNGKLGYSNTICPNPTN
jgi:hypothetical protein